MSNERRLVTNPLAEVILGLVVNPQSFGPMVKDALSQSAGVVLQQIGVRLQNQESAPSNPNEKDGNDHGSS